MRQLIDISATLQTGIASDPPGIRPDIDYYTHADTAADLLAFFPGASKEDLPDGEGWAFEWVRATTHNGTHLDAPYHYSAVMDGGARAATIDEVPLEWCSPESNSTSGTSHTGTSPRRPTSRKNWPVSDTNCPRSKSSS